MIAIAEKKSVPLGRLVATPSAIKALKVADQSYIEFVDWELNDQSLENGNRPIRPINWIK